MKKIFVSQLIMAVVLWKPMEMLERTLPQLQVALIIVMVKFVNWRAL